MGRPATQISVYGYIIVIITTSYEFQLNSLSLQIKISNNLNELT